MTINIDDFDIIAFDADGTIRRCTVANQPCPNADGEWELLPGVKERIQAIDWSRRTFGIVSNQAGVALGYLSEEQAMKMLADCARACVSDAPDYAVVVELCPHATDAGCECRKPKPEMLFRVVRQHVHATMREDADPDREFERFIERTLYVGDLATDEQAAKAAGVQFAWAWDFFGKTREEWWAMLGELALRDKQRVCSHATPSEHAAALRPRDDGRPQTEKPGSLESGGFVTPAAAKRLCGEVAIRETMDRLPVSFECGLPLRHDGDHGLGAPKSGVRLSLRERVTAALGEGVADLFEIDGSDAEVVMRLRSLDELDALPAIRDRLDLAGFEATALWGGEISVREVG